MCESCSYISVPIAPLGPVVTVLGSVLELATILMV